MGQIKAWRLFWGALLGTGLLFGLAGCQGYGSVAAVQVGKDEVPDDPVREPGDRSRRITWQEPFQRADRNKTCLRRNEMGGVRVFLADAPGGYDIAAPYLEIPIGVYECRELGEDPRCGTTYECTHPLGELEPGLWYFSMKAYDTANQASAFSNETSTFVE